MRILLSFGILLALSTTAFVEARERPLGDELFGASSVYLSDEAAPPERAGPPPRTAPARVGPPPEARRGQQRAEEPRQMTEEELQRAEEWRERRAAGRAGRIGRPVEGVGFSGADRAQIASIPLDRYPPGIQRRIAEGRGLPPGLERRGERERGLPEGWHLRLEPGRVLDTELERGVTEIPRSLRRNLPTVPPDHEDILVGDRLVRVKRHSREIVDSVPVGPGRAAEVETPADPGPASERARGARR
ncbi:MAG: hypothetical protein JJU00_19505 [Opitutales bacterium]|nr:hypothetical protein [Opitutales bacterium]